MDKDLLIKLARTILEYYGEEISKAKKEDKPKKDRKEKKPEAESIVSVPEVEVDEDVSEISDDKMKDIFESIDSFDD